MYAAQESDAGAYLPKADYLTTLQIGKPDIQWSDKKITNKVYNSSYQLYPSNTGIACTIFNYQKCAAKYSNNLFAEMSKTFVD